MQKDFMFEYFSSMHKIIMELDKYMSEDNALYVEDCFNKIESITRKTRKLWGEALNKMIKGEK